MKHRFFGNDSNRHGRACWLLASFGPLAGLAALIWFLMRVIPKPSRATYPCQRAAASLASGFVVWVAGVVGARLLRRKALAAGWRGSAAVAALAGALYLIWLPLGIAPGAGAQEAFTPSEAPNQPTMSSAARRGSRITPPSGPWPSSGFALPSRCWKDRAPYEERRYQRTLQRRQTPPATAELARVELDFQWKTSAGFPKLASLCS